MGCDSILKSQYGLFHNYFQGGGVVALAFIPQQPVTRLKTR